MAKKKADKVGAGDLGAAIDHAKKAWEAARKMDWAAWADEMSLVYGEFKLANEGMKADPQKFGVASHEDCCPGDDDMDALEKKFDACVATLEKGDGPHKMGADGDKTSINFPGLFEKVMDALPAILQVIALFKKK